MKLMGVKFSQNIFLIGKENLNQLVKKIQSIEGKFRSGQEKLQVELDKVQREELTRLRDIVTKAIEEYAEKNNFDIVLRADGTTLYAKKYINITQDIISKLQ